MSGVEARVVAVPVSADLDYAGDVQPTDAWDVLQSDPRAVLVDVRTPAEWASVGEPDLSSLNRTPLRLPWKLAPGYTQNTDFIPQFAAEGIAKDVPIILLCKVGGRSLDAALALTAAGWSRCYNLADGFEGDPNAQGERGTVNGWKAAGLPWGRK